MNNDKIQYLQMIQDVIRRMSDNSRAMKGWCLAALSAIIGFAANSGNSKLLWIGAVASLMFWAIDACYLATERKYVSLYNKAAEPDSDIPLFYMGNKKYKQKRDCFLAAFFGSWSTMPFYLPLVLVMSLMAALNWLDKNSCETTTVRCNNVVIEKLTPPNPCQSQMPPPPHHHHHHFR